MCDLIIHFSQSIILCEIAISNKSHSYPLKFYIILNDIKRIHSIAEKVYKNLTKDGKKRDWIDDFRKRYEIDEIIFYDAPYIIAVVINKE